MLGGADETFLLKKKQKSGWLFILTVGGNVIPL